MKKILVLVSVVMAVIITILYKRNQSLNEDLSLAYTNLKAYAGEVSSLKDESRLYRLTLDQIKSYSDSINQKLLAAQKKLKIKDKEVAYYQYIASKAQRSDTIFIRDTIFRDPAFKLDTILGDSWFSVKLDMRYPNNVTVSPKFRSSLSIIGSLKKETIKPPKKCFIGRWFQKKHKVMIVDVYEENKYVDSIKRRFIQVIK